MIRLTATLAACVLASTALGEPVHDPAHVIEGDTLGMDQAAVRLADIDAPKLGALGMMLNVLEDYQTLISGSVGFIGIIITLFINARLARKARVEEIAHEQNALRTALAAEITIYLESLAKNINKGVPSAGSPILVPILDTNEIYALSREKLGLLTEIEVKK